MYLPAKYLFCAQAAKKSKYLHRNKNANGLAGYSAFACFCRNKEAVACRKRKRFSAAGYVSFSLDGEHGDKRCAVGGKVELSADIFLFGLKVLTIGKNIAVFVMGGGPERLRLHPKPFQCVTRAAFRRCRDGRNRIHDRSNSSSAEFPQ